MKQSNRRLNRERKEGRQRTGLRAVIIDKLKKQNVISLQLNKFFKKETKQKPCDQCMTGHVSNA